MAPSAGNEVFLTGDRDAAGLYRPAARCVIGAGDFRNVETTLRLLGESLIESGKGRVLHQQRTPVPAADWRRAHHGDLPGWGRASRTPVVDRDCHRVHGYDNLFVAGSSVFPTGGYANPTLTIVALALRLADTLATAG